MLLKLYPEVCRSQHPVMKCWPYHLVTDKASVETWAKASPSWNWLEKYFLLETGSDLWHLAHTCLAYLGSDFNGSNFMLC